MDVTCILNFMLFIMLADLRHGEVSQIEASSSSGICCSQHFQQSTSGDILKLNGACLEQLVKASNMGLFELSPADELEGELVYYQHRLLCNAAARKRFSGLCYKPHLPFARFSIIASFSCMRIAENNMHLLLSFFMCQNSWLLLLN